MYHNNFLNVDCVSMLPTHSGDFFKLPTLLKSTFFLVVGCPRHVMLYETIFL